MPRLPISAAAPGLFWAAALGLTLAAAPAFAQDEGAGGDERVNQLIIYGDDPCPNSDNGEITVCARKPEGERFRIPEPLRGVDSPKADAWTNKVEAYETVGAFGNMSCSPVGPGGASGCNQRLIDRAYAEKKNGSDVRFSELVAAERERRLSTIDEDAAEQQTRVEAAEKAYFEQRQRQEAAEDAALPATPPKP